MSDIAARAAAFVAKWEAIQINERAVAQTHFNELCALLGVPAPLDAGQRPDDYRFEKPLTKSGGGAGFADVWRRDHFAWEYKTKGKYADLRAAYTQLVLYKFETYPFPWAPGAEPSEAASPVVKEIAEAARELVRLRDAWLGGGGGGPQLPDAKRTLTTLYNQRPDWLAAAHRRLDAAVCAAYGWPDDLDDDAILARLLALNLRRAAAQGAAPATGAGEEEDGAEG